MANESTKIDSKENESIHRSNNIKYKQSEDVRSRFPGCPIFRDHIHWFNSNFLGRSGRYSKALTQLCGSLRAKRHAGLASSIAWMGPKSTWIPGDVGRELRETPKEKLGRDFSMFFSESLLTPTFNH